ncbi:TIGR01777 family oxidoreductase [Pseudoalteromonas sp. T1lg88]|uniref:TIGR01777 family oxidoreductase n=1 Tax=Pseudoalteromonas sp. T1lg88 TaxID=2077104 RepID=UPI000CF6C4AB|nr:TIGR01777 family oxidoreductase [Pseudoalteromonas sp. T1lg88]
MNILITGATGLIGSELYKHLLNHHSVTVLTRTPANAYLKLGHRIEAVRSLDKVDFNDTDVVINLAGEPIVNKRWTPEQKQRVYDSRITLTEEIAERINQAEKKPKTLISGSAIGYYGRQGEQVIGEDYEHCYDEFSHQLCKDWEQAAQKAQTRVCLLRTGIVLSARGGALTKMLPAFRCGLGGPLGDGHQYMSWIHLDDMVQVIMYLIKYDHISGPINATAPHPVSNEEFSKTLAQILRRPAFLRMPKAVLRLLMGEMADLMLYGQNVQPKRMLKEGFRFRHPELRPALAQILSRH